LLQAPAAEGHAYYDYWGYQTCTEFGFYQTCEVGSNCFFTQGLNVLSDDDSFCSSFGITPKQIEANIEATNNRTQGLRPDLPPLSATRIMYPNGDVDPWHGLSIIKSPSDAIPTLMVSGASHHAWTHPSAPTDQATAGPQRATAPRQQLGLAPKSAVTERARWQASVVAARKTIGAQVLKWLSE